MKKENLTIEDFKKIMKDVVDKMLTDIDKEMEGVDSIEIFKTKLLKKLEKKLL